VIRVGLAPHSVWAGFEPFLQALCVGDAIPKGMLLTDLVQRSFVIMHLKAVHRKIRRA
jgi:hypothetical protein